MLQQSNLLEANPHLGLFNDLYRDQNNHYRDSDLSNELRIAIDTIFNSAKDRSLFSTELESLLNTDQLRFELSPAPYQYVTSLNSNNIGHVLDLTQDFGGVSHYFSDRANTIDSVKLDIDRARLSQVRCRDRNNVFHITEDLQNLEFPKQHYQLILVDALEELQLSQQDLKAVLQRLQQSLTPTGVLAITASNPNRVAKLFSPSNKTDHYTANLESNRLNRDVNRIPYLELYQSNNGPQLLELHAILNESNFGETISYCTFSDNENCHNLFSEDYLTSSTNSLNHFYRLGAVRNSKINEYLLFKNLRDSQQRAFDLASRYVFFCGANADSIRSFIDLDFVHYPGTSRKPCWRATTQRVRGAAKVNKQLRHPEKHSDHKTDSQVVVTQNLSDQPFYKGDALIGSWLSAVLNCDVSLFNNLVNEYLEWLNDQQSKPDFNQFAYDLLPFNIMVNSRNNAYQVIDVEWEISGVDLSADYVLFRALFWFAFENRAILSNYITSLELSSINQFILYHHPNIGHVSELTQFVELEETIQQQIGQSFRANSIQQSLQQSLFDLEHAPLRTIVECQLCWGTADNAFDEANALTTNWELNHQQQELAFENINFSNEKPVLRIDPIASLGIFKVKEIKLFDSSTKEIASFDSKQVLKNAVLHNIKQDGNNLIALNSDPHLTLNLELLEIDSGKLKNLSGCQISVKLVKDAHYESSLKNLTDAVGLQDQALIRQSNRIDQYRAKLEYQNRIIEQLTTHRTDLKENTDQLKLDYEKQLANLNEQLTIQVNRNQELLNFLSMRPTTRGKRFVRRTVDRISGKQPEVIEQPEEIDIADQKDEYGLPAHGELIGQNVEDYQLWVQQNDLTPEQIEQAKAEIETFKHKPVFSILVPIYNTDLEYLLPMIRSVQAQIYPHWQLCLVDDCSPNDYLKSILEYEVQQDPRISLQLNDHNQGISLTTNDALAMATGDFIGLLDHDDEISVDALYHNAKAINQNDDVDLLYSDEDKMDMQGNRLEPYFKPDFSPDLLHTNNYICHFTVIRKTVADEIGGFREGLDGSQDHDIILRAASKARKIVHIPRILYHWRKIPGSTAVVYDSKSYAWEAGRKAVENSLLQNESDVRVEFGSLKGTYRVFREIKGNPLISIVIPFKDKPELLHTCLNSILQRSTYENFEVVGVSNNSELDETFEAMKHFSELDSRIRFVEKNVPFNFSEVCNFGVEHANGEYIVLLNNDIEIISADWIERLLEHAQRPEVGAVGGKLLYPDGRIQHAGVVAGMVGAAGHPHKFFPDNHIGYHGRLHMVYNVSAVTGAMLMVSKQKFIDAGGLDQDHLAVAYNDIDFCLSLIDQGYYNVFTPHCKATHHESISRGYEDTPEKLERLKREQSFFLEKWQTFLANGDPYYNPNLSLKNERFSLNYKD